MSENIHKAVESIEQVLSMLQDNSNKKIKQSRSCLEESLRFLKEAQKT
jgi:hypothetical protein